MAAGATSGPAEIITHTEVLETIGHTLKGSVDHLAGALHTFLANGVGQPADWGFTAEDRQAGEKYVRGFCPGVSDLLPLVSAKVVATGEAVGQWAKQFDANDQTIAQAITAQVEQLVGR
jgi:hypothetical protein